MRADKPEEQFEGSDDELLAALRPALAPEPLPRALRQRILADWDRRLPARRSRLRPIRIAWLAAAACLLFALILPSRRHLGPAGPDSMVDLSSADAAEIVVAYGVLSWDSSLDYTIDAVSNSLESISRALEATPGEERSRIWDDDDDWDIPPTTDEDSGRSRGPTGALCSAARNWKLEG